MLGWLVVFAAPAWGQAFNPKTFLKDHIHDVWLSEDGLPQNSIYGVTQGKAGFMWIATDEGLARFDGLSFQVYTSAQGLADNVLNCIMEDSKGRLWVGTYDAGLSIFEKGKFSNYDTDDGIGDNRIWNIVEAPNGDVWLATKSGLTRWRDGAFVNFTKEDGLSSNWIYSIYHDPKGVLWIGTEDGGLNTYKDGKFQPFPLMGQAKGSFILSIAGTPNGDVWMGTSKGLLRLQGETQTLYTTEDGLLHNSVEKIFTDRDGRLWVATSSGLNVVVDSRIMLLSESGQILKGKPVTFAQDRHGSIWIGTEGMGLHLFRKRAIWTLGLQEGVSSNWAYSIARHRGGGLWVGTREGVDLIQTDKTVHYTAKDGLYGGEVWSLNEDSLGRLWVAIGGSGINIIENGTISVLKADKPLSDNWVFCLQPDSNGGMWIGTGLGLNYIRNGQLEVYSEEDGLVNAEVLAVKPDGDDGLWIGTSGGLSHLKNGTFTNYTKDKGLSSNVVMGIHLEGDRVWLATSNGFNLLEHGKVTPFTTQKGLHQSAIYAILQDDRQNLWMSGNKGLVKVAIQEILDVKTGQKERLDLQVFGKQDGMSNPECNGGTSPVALKDRDGFLYFASVGGVVKVNPEKPEPFQSPVFIEKVLADGERLENQPNLTIGPGLERLEFHFTGLDLLVPGKVSFRFKLEGWDKEWHYSGKRNFAHYTNLPSGPYRFIVHAKNSSGTWNQVQQPFAFTLLAHFYQTGLFYAAVLILAVLGGFGLHRLRVQKIERHEAELERMVSAKTKELKAMYLELQAAQAQVVDAAHQAGKAEIATSVLHNVGNALNSANISLDLINESLDDFRMETLEKVNQLIQKNIDQLRPFFTDDPKGKQVPGLLGRVAEFLTGARLQLETEVKELQRQIVHLNDIVTTQLDYSEADRLWHQVDINRLIQDAVTIKNDLFVGANVHIEMDLQPVAPVRAVKLKLLEVIMHLLSNACESLRQSDERLRVISISSVSGPEDTIQVTIADNGVGIPSERLKEVFFSGTTTKEDHKGFGLHFCANAVKEMGGSIRVTSDGVNCGACFILALKADHRGIEASDSLTS